MSRRLSAVVWVLVAAAVWSGVFDLYVSRGAREYLQRAAEAELGRGPSPSMTAVMAEARRAGAEAASAWAVVILAAAWATRGTGRRP